MSSATPVMEEFVRDDMELRTLAADIAATAIERYEELLEDNPAMRDMTVQGAIFAHVVQRLAVEGAPLSAILTAVYRAYGLDARSIKITDAKTGATLLKIDG